MASETLRPNGLGFAPGGQTWPSVTGGDNWTCIDDVSADDFTTYAGNNAAADGNDILCTITSNSIGVSDTINSITIYYRINAPYTKFGINSAAALYRENSVSTPGTMNTSQDVWTTFSQTFTVRGSDSTAFTKSDIDSLEIGCRADQQVPGQVYLTQVYVVVDYTPSGGGGGSPVVKPIMMMLETDD